MRIAWPIPLTKTALATGLASVTLMALPAAAADPAQGARIAQRWCASCHVASPGQPRANADAPSFAAISATRNIQDIIAFLSKSHANMPDMALSRDEIADLIAHMQTLAPPLDPQKPAPQKDEPPKNFRG